jgi:hypothetical protein
VQSPHPLFYIRSKSGFWRTVAVAIVYKSKNKNNNGEIEKEKKENRLQDGK